LLVLWAASGGPHRRPLLGRARALHGAAAEQENDLVSARPRRRTG